MSELPLAICKGKEAGQVSLAVKSEAELKNLRLWNQGDEAMYEVQALEARYRNRSDPVVWKYLNAWWETAMRGANVDPKSNMPKAVYVDLYVRVCKALLEEGEEWDEKEAERIVNGAWEEDSRGSGRLTRTMFNDGLFEYLLDIVRIARPSPGGRVLSWEFTLVHARVPYSPQTRRHVDADYRRCRVPDVSAAPTGMHRGRHARTQQLQRQNQ